MQTVHINLISEQLIPNMIPTLQDNECIGVILVLGDQRFQKKADLLRTIYKRNNINVIFEVMGDSSARLKNLQGLATQVLDYLSNHYAADNIHWVLNATCGTKPMSLTFTNAFNLYNQKAGSQDTQGPKALVLYTDTEHKEIPLLNEDTDFALPFTDVLTLDDSLMANGFEFENAIDADKDFEVVERQDLTLFLLKQFAADSCKFFLGPLQFAASSARQQFPDNAAQQLKMVPKGARADLLNRLVKAGLIEWDQQKNIHFLTEDACIYLAGGWLEEATYLIAKSVGFKHVALGVSGNWREEVAGFNIASEVTNELDVLILHHNRLLVVECKALNWAKQDSQKNQGVIHKLENLGRKLGGHFASSLLISAQQLTPTMQQRIDSSNVDYIDAPCTETALTNKLNKWKNMVS